MASIVGERRVVSFGHGLSEASGTLECDEASEGRRRRLDARDHATRFELEPVTHPHAVRREHALRPRHRRRRELRRVQCKTGRLRDGAVLFRDVQPLRATTRIPKALDATTRARSTTSPSSVPSSARSTSIPIEDVAATSHRRAPRRPAAERSTQEGPPRSRVRGRADRRLLKDLARLLVRQDLPLHALQRVVDRLRVAAEVFRHLLVRRALEVQPQRVRLERRERRREAADERLRAPPSRSRFTDGSLTAGPGQRVAEGAVVALLAGRGVAERHVLVQRRVLEARRRLDRRDDLPRHAQLGERTERRLLVGPEVAHRLVEADEALLDQVLRVAAGEEVRSSPSAGRTTCSAGSAGPWRRTSRCAPSGRAADPQALVEPSAVTSGLSRCGRTRWLTPVCWRFSVRPPSINHRSLTLRLR